MVELERYQKLWIYCSHSLSRTFQASTELVPNKYFCSSNRSYFTHWNHILRTKWGRHWWNPILPVYKVYICLYRGSWFSFTSLYAFSTFTKFVLFKSLREYQYFGWIIISGTSKNMKYIYSVTHKECIKLVFSMLIFLGKVWFYSKVLLQPWRQMTCMWPTTWFIFIVKFDFFNKISWKRLFLNFKKGQWEKFFFFILYSFINCQPSSVNLAFFHCFENFTCVDFTTLTKLLQS